MTEGQGYVGQSLQFLSDSVWKRMSESKEGPNRMI